MESPNPQVKRGDGLHQLGPHRFWPSAADGGNATSLLGRRPLGADPRRAVDAGCEQPQRGVHQDPEAARDDECDGACGRYRTGPYRNTGSTCGFVAVGQHLEGH